MGRGTGELNMLATAALIKAVIVKAPVKAANFAEISAFMIISSVKGCGCRCWAALKASLVHCAADVVSLPRTVNRIGAH
jgi:hypothetical protein